jgi:hypothetical protein
MSNAAASLPFEKTAIRKVVTRLVPFVALMFFISCTEQRSGFAAPNGMEEDLVLTGAQFVIYFSFIYGLYAFTSFVPIIIAGFQEQFGTKFTVIQKGPSQRSRIYRLLLSCSCGPATLPDEACVTRPIARRAFLGAISVPSR